MFKQNEIFTTLFWRAFQRRYQPSFSHTSKPFKSALNRSPRQVTLAPAPVGQVNRPCSSRLAQHHRPVPSQNKIFTRLRGRLAYTNR